MPEVHDYSKIVVQHAEIGRRKLGIPDAIPAPKSEKWKFTLGRNAAGKLAIVIAEQQQ